jgi:hypothetical protein
MSEEQPVNEQQITDEQVADLMHDSARYIEENGWTRHELRIDNAVCTVGAMLFSQGLSTNVPLARHPLVMTACDALADALHLEGSNVRHEMWSVNAVTSWNDEAGDEQIILDGLRKVEKIKRAGFDPDE